MLSYFPLGIACGIALEEVGYSAATSFWISMSAYTGAGQFALANMVVQGASALSIFITILFLNLRLTLQTSSILPYVNHRSTGFQLLFAQVTTDESYGVNMTAFAQDEGWTSKKALIASILAWLTWSCSVFLGNYLGSSLNIPTTVVNYILIAMFISMAVDQLVSRIHVVAALVTMASAVLLQALLQSSLSIVLATLLGAGVGYFLQQRLDDREGMVK